MPLNTCLLYAIILCHLPAEQRLGHSCQPALPLSGHAGGRGVVEGLSKQLGLNPRQMAPSANTLHWQVDVVCLTAGRGLTAWHSSWWAQRSLSCWIRAPSCCATCAAPTPDCEPLIHIPPCRYGNTSSSTVWYSFGYIESVQGVRKGDIVWQVGRGAGAWVAGRAGRGGFPA